MKRQFSVTMAVYKNDKSEDFKNAVYSIYQNQTVKPSEIILVQDGPISESLQSAINELESDIPVMKVIKFHQNKGHAAARQAGLENATNELIAIMDSDDISVPNRFEKTLEAFDNHPDASVIGSNINEFIGDVKHIIGRRIVPEYDDCIKQYLKSRCPMNLMTVMYRKSKVQEVGGFIDWYCEEDYYLWIRLAMAGHKFYNIQENLVNVRVGSEMYSRRGGWKYFKSEFRLQKFMLNNRVINLFNFIYNTIIRFVVQVILPNWLRAYVFKMFARS